MPLLKDEAVRAICGDPDVLAHWRSLAASFPSNEDPNRIIQILKQQLNRISNYDAKDLFRIVNPHGCDCTPSDLPLNKMKLQLLDIINRQIQAVGESKQADLKPNNLQTFIQSQQRQNDIKAAIDSETKLEGHYDSACGTGFGSTSLLTFSGIIFTTLGAGYDSRSYPDPRIIMSVLGTVIAIPGFILTYYYRKASRERRAEQQIYAAKLQDVKKSIPIDEDIDQITYLSPVGITQQQYAQLKAAERFNDPCAYCGSSSEDKDQKEGFCYNKDNPDSLKIVFTATQTGENTMAFHGPYHEGGVQKATADAEKKGQPFRDPQTRASIKIDGEKKAEESPLVATPKGKHCRLFFIPPQENSENKRVLAPAAKEIDFKAQNSNPEVRVEIEGQDDSKNERRPLLLQHRGAS